MSDWNDVAIRNGLASKLAEITDQTAHPYLQSNPIVPCSYVFADAVTFDVTNAGGLDRVPYTVRVLVGTLDSTAAQELLASYRGRNGAKSIKTKLEEDMTLGGVCHDVTVRSVSPDQLFTFEGGGPYLGADFTVDVYA